MTVTFAGPLHDPSLPILSHVKAQTISHLVFTLANLDMRYIFDFRRDLRGGLSLEISIRMSDLMLQCVFMGWARCIFKAYFSGFI